MLINERYFSHPKTRIAGIDTRSDGKLTPTAERIIRDINAFVEVYEPRFLRMFLGPDAAAMVESCQPHEATKTAEALESLRALLADPGQGTSVIAKYVYFYYSRENITFNTMAGEKLKITENSRAVTPTVRLVHLWNEMVDECREIVNTLNRERRYDLPIFPDFDAEIFEKINVYNL